MTPPGHGPFKHKVRNSMFFMTKEKSGRRASLKEEKPREPRYSCVAHVCINGFDGEAVLRNINSGGFRMESRTYAAISVGERYSLRIIPEASANVKPVELEVEARWVKSTETSFNTGFLIVKYPADKSFEKYIDHMKNRNYTP
jgi:hypothetical protein